MLSYCRENTMLLCNHWLCKIAVVQLGLRAIFKSQTQERIAEMWAKPMPNVMAALPNIGGALCSTPQSLADAHY